MNLRSQPFSAWLVAQYLVVFLGLSLGSLAVWKLLKAEWPKLRKSSKLWRGIDFLLVKWPGYILMTIRGANQTFNEKWPIWYLWCRDNLARVLALYLAFLMGHLWRDVQLVDRTSTFYKVRVLEKYDDLNFLLATRTGLPWKATFCPTHIPHDFVKGATIEVMVFENQDKCKDLGGDMGYTMLRDERTGRLILANLEGQHVR